MSSVLATAPPSYPFRLPALSAATSRVLAVLAATGATLSMALVLGFEGLTAGAIAGQLSFEDQTIAELRMTVALGTVLATAAIFVLAWLLARIETRGRRPRGSDYADLRDALLRLAGGTAAAFACLWAAARIELALARAATGTPFEGLTVSVSMAVGAVLLALILRMLWRLPHSVLRWQLRGRLTPDAIAESLWFLAIAAAAALVYGYFEEGVGRACWIALGAGGAFAWVRLAFPLPPRAPGPPLWIVVLPRRADRAEADAAGQLGAAWKIGPVTLLAPPDCASALGGAHLRACASTRQLEPLFPTSAIHLTDWDDALPPAWTALPVRELYAPAELWPQIFSGRITTNALVVAILGSAAPYPKRVMFYGVPVSNVPRLHSQLDMDGLRALAEPLSGKELWARIKELQPPEAQAVRRRILVLHPTAEATFAQHIVEFASGQADARGHTIDAWALPYDATPASAGLMWRMVWLWRHRLARGARSLEKVPATSRIQQLAMRLFPLFFGSGAKGEYDLVIVESGSAIARRSAEVFEQMIASVRERIVDRLVAVRAPNDPADAALAFPADLYAGEIRWPAGETPEARAQAVTKQLLALEFAPVLATSSVPPATDTSTGTLR